MWALDKTLYVKYFYNYSDWLN